MISKTEAVDGELLHSIHSAKSVSYEEDGKRRVPLRAIDIQIFERPKQLCISYTTPF